MKIKQFIIEKKQLILYALCGVLTTAVSLAACYVALQASALVFHDESGNPNAIADVIGSTAQWVSGVLVAFVTNKLWVFTEAEKGRSATWRQLAIFSGSRIATYFVEVGVNLGAIALLDTVLAGNEPRLVLFGITLTLGARLWAKVISSVFVVIANYYISKLLVFRKKEKK